MKPSDLDITTAAGDIIIDDTSKETTAVVLAIADDKLFTAFKGKMLDMSLMFNRILSAKEGQLAEFAKLLVATPFVTCMTCQDETRKKELFDMIDGLYQQLYLYITK